MGLGNSMGFLSDVCCRWSRSLCIASGETGIPVLVVFTIWPIAVVLGLKALKCQSLLLHGLQGVFSFQGLAERIF